MDSVVKMEPRALDKSPAAAYASHRARIANIAEQFANDHPLEDGFFKADEDNTMQLMAHLHMIDEDRNFSVGPVRSLPLLIKMLGQMRMGDGNEEGEVGTNSPPFRVGDYDMAAKGLIAIAHRYPHLLKTNDFDGVSHILENLLPEDLKGPFDADIETWSAVEQIPESENHLLMIHSTKYLANQLLTKRHNDMYDNTTNGVTKWLLEHMQTIAKHDFLEFNARPYARHSLHALFNLHEFAAEKSIRTAAQIILDYTMVKFAISSNWQRRICPFRRLPENTNRPDHANELRADDRGADALTGFFLMYVGPTEIDGTPANEFFASWHIFALIAGLAAYRPPPAAYTLAMLSGLPAYQHRFYHGTRPVVRGTDDVADGGVEIYYRSPSFLLTAGGMFLNSGYGGDEWPVVQYYKNTAIAQSTTLIPTKAYVKFTDLIRFDPFPDERQAVNTGVHRGFACGANLRTPDKRILSDTTTHAPALTVHNQSLFMAWKGSGNQNLNVVKVDAAGELGVPGFATKVTNLSETSTEGPALASHDGRLFIAWKGAGNENLNLSFSEDNGLHFPGKKVFADTSEQAPALVSHGGHLFLAWTGVGEGKLNIARVKLFGNNQGGFGIEGIENKVTLNETSTEAPALVSHGGRLFIAWKGAGNKNLNLIFSDDDGMSFHGKKIFSDTSYFAPALASHGGQLFLSWAGVGDQQLNAAKVSCGANAAGDFEIGDLEEKQVFNDTSDAAPALVSYGGHVYLCWKGSGNDNINFWVSAPDGKFQTGPWYFGDFGEYFGFYVAAYRTPFALDDDPDFEYGPPEVLNSYYNTVNFGCFYAMEVSTQNRPPMSFEDFKSRTLAYNSGLPNALVYDKYYDFRTPDDQKFRFWNRPCLKKYEARIFDPNDNQRVIDFTKLPLVQGEYLNAPGHDGYIEIRQPECGEPIILDFTEVTTPKRSDNKVACPGPWLERTKALFQFSLAAKSKHAQYALTDRARIFKELWEARREAYSLDFSSAMLLALGKAGVEFNVPQANPHEWLNESQYVAIADALLTLLENKPLRKPAELEVIVRNYHLQHRRPSPPREVTEIDLVELRKAVIKGFNDRYHQHFKALEEIVQ